VDIAGALARSRRPGSENMRSPNELSVFFVLLFLSACVGQKTASAGLPLDPSVVIDLKKVGWRPALDESNRSFFKDFSTAKLEALDDTTKILFLTKDLVVVYHTNQQGTNWRTATRQLEAFFISAKDGSLLRTKTWPTVQRRSRDELRDSEARLIPLQDGRFLVMANGRMMLYESNLELVKELELSPFTSTDLWAVQTVAEGKQIFLRHESQTDLHVTYSWLASDTLRVLREMPGYQAKNFDVLRNVTAGEQGVFTFSDSGIRMIAPGPSIKTICDDRLCDTDGENFQVISSRYLAISGKKGIGIVDIGRGLAWSKTVGPEYDSPKYDPHMFQFGETVSNLSGSRLAVWVTSEPKGIFDGVKINSSPTLFVYDVLGLRRLSLVSIKSVNGQWDVAFSPDGAKLAVYDGAKLKIYAVG